MKTTQTIVVVGSGTMGNGIAHVAALAGHQVVLYDIRQPALDQALATISKNLDREVAKNKIQASDKTAAVQRIQTTTQEVDLVGADFVIEAVVENFETKVAVFETLDRTVRPDVILASNTSSISITKIAS